MFAMTLSERMVPRPGTAQARGSGGVAAAALGMAWYVSLMRPVWAAAALGPICGHHGLLVVHCPACYLAVALMAAGAGLVATARA